MVDSIGDKSVEEDHQTGSLDTENFADDVEEFQVRFCSCT